MSTVAAGQFIYRRAAGVSMFLDVPNAKATNTQGGVVR